MELQLFVFKNLAVHFYYPSKSLHGNRINVKNLCLYFSGLPNYTDKDFFAEHVKRGTAFFAVYYYGSWLSGGRFTVDNCRNSINDAINFAKGRTGIKTFDNKKLTWNFENLYLIGYSFAGNPLLTISANKKEIKKVILYSPLIYLYGQEVKNILGEKETERFSEFNIFFLEFLQRGYPHALRGIKGKEWKKYFFGKDRSSRIKLSSSYPPISIYHGNKDSQISHRFSEHFYKMHQANSKLTIVSGMGHDKGMFNLNHLKP